MTVLERPVTSTPWSPTWNRRMRNPSLSVSIQSHHWADDEQDDRRDQLSDVRLAGTLLSVRGYGLIRGLIWGLVRGLILGSRHRFVFWACFNCCSSVASRISCEAAYSRTSAVGPLDEGDSVLLGSAEQSLVACPQTGARDQHDGAEQVRIDWAEPSAPQCMDRDQSQ